MSLAKLNEFIRALLFGHVDYKIPKDNVVQQLVEDMNTNVQEIIRNGGLLDITGDLDTITQFLEECNAHFHYGSEPPPVLHLKSNIAKMFFNQLSVICKGNVELGIVANSYQKQKELDLTYIEDMIRNKSVVTLPLQGLEQVHLTNNIFKNVLILYDVKCKSLGRVIDPFSLVLSHHQDHADAVHWQSKESLKMFCRHYPKHKLAIEINNLLKSSLTAILNADEEMLPFELNNEFRKFFYNVNFINERVEKVETKYTPPKLIDLFLRLLALTKMDNLWIQENIPPPPQSNQYVLDLYLKNVELTRENELLNGLIKSNTWAAHLLDSET